MVRLPNRKAVSSTISVGGSWVSHNSFLETGFWALCRHPNYFGSFLIYGKAWEAYAQRTKKVFPHIC